MNSYGLKPDDDWNEEEQGYWLAYDQLSGPGLGVSKARQLVERLGSMKSVWSAKRHELAELRLINFETIDAFLKAREKVDPEKLLADLRAAEVEAYPLYHPLYPMCLRQIHDPPTVLYKMGNLHPDDFRCAVAVVGTRKPTAYGSKLSKEIAFGLASAGVTIVSGMAVGIDSLAHWGAINGGGKTIAVLATGPDLCYPSSNKPLYQLLTEGKYGAVVSEYFPGTKAEKWRFPARNRIISGLSEATAVIEAGESSGAIITAKIAFDQGRDVFAIPGRLDQPMSVGTNRLIADLTARLVTSWQEIFDLKGWQSVPRPNAVPTVVELFGREKEVFEMLSGEPVHFDYLCERAGMPAGELSATLTMLELAGIIERQAGDWYTRCASSSVIH